MAWFLRRQKLRTRAQSLRLIPENDTANVPPFLPQSAPPPRFSRQNWLPTVVASWTLTPVLLWGNAFQAPEVDQPAPGGRAWVEGVVGAWEADPYRQQPRRLAPQVVAAAAADKPYASALADLVAAWQPSEQQPIQRRLGQILSVDDPPFIERAWVATVRAAWEPDVVFGAQARARAPIPAPDNPPFGATRWVGQVRQMWEPDPWAFQARIGVAQTPAAAVDNPPFGLRPWLGSAIASWTQEWPAWQRPRSVTQGAVVAADNPPFGLRSWAPTVRDAWEPPAYKPQVPAHVIQPAAVDNPPFGLRPWLGSAIASWTQEWPAWQRPRSVTQGAVVAADNPPFGLRSWAPTVRDAWEPPAYKPQVLAHVVQPGANPPPPGVQAGRATRRSMDEERSRPRQTGGARIAQTDTTRRRS